MLYHSALLFTTRGRGLGERSIVSSALFVCLSVHEHISRTTRPIFTNFVHGLVLIWRRCDALYVLPVLCMTSYLHTKASDRRRENGAYSRWLNGGQQYLIPRGILNWPTRGSTGPASRGVWYLRLSCDERVSMSVRMYVSKTNDVSELHEIICACYAAATVLLWRHCDIFRTSGFVDYVILTHYRQE